MEVILLGPSIPTEADYKKAETIKLLLREFQSTSRSLRVCMQANGRRKGAFRQARRCLLYYRQVRRRRGLTLEERQHRRQLILLLDDWASAMKGLRLLLDIPRDRNAYGAAQDFLRDHRTRCRIASRIEYERQRWDSTHLQRPYHDTTRVSVQPISAGHFEGNRRRH